MVYYLNNVLLLSIHSLLSSFLVVMDLRCCTQAFASCGEQGLLFAGLQGLCCCKTQAQQFWHTGLVAPRRVASSPTPTEPVSSVSASGFSTTGPPGKSASFRFKI